MCTYSFFLSVVIVFRNSELILEEVISNSLVHIQDLTADFELIIVDNSSNDASVSLLRRMASENRYPNLQVFALTSEVDFDTASWVGLENALGDFVAVIDPLHDDLSFLPTMLDKASNGADVVFANNLKKPPQKFSFRFAHYIFNCFYQAFNGIHLAKDAPRSRLLSKRVVNYILQYPQPSLSYRHLPASSGFARINLEYSSDPLPSPAKNLFDSFDRGMRLLVSTTHLPMRLVTALSLFGAVTNLIYSVYVLTVGIFKSDVAPGWVSLSLQQSGMFFLISLVLLVLSEYILHMVRLGNEGPLYHVGHEFTSVRMMHREKLNIEDVSSSASNVISSADRVSR